MRQGTTPTHIYTLPFDTGLIQSIQVTYAQNKKIVLQKKTADIIVSGQTATCELTQEETFLFDPSAFVDIQVRVLIGGEALTSDIIRIGVARCLDREVLL